MRKFILFLTLALMVTAFAVPAFASSPSELVANIEGGEFSLDVGLKPGVYSLELFDSSNRAAGTFELEYSGGAFEQRFAFVDYGSDVELVVTGSDGVTRGGVFWAGDVTPYAFQGKLVFTPLSTPDPVSPTDGIFSVFSSMGVYLMGALSSLTVIFWTGSSLTIVGVLAVCALAIALALYVIYLIRSFW